jgi:hypothetical protein
MLLVVVANTIDCHEFKSSRVRVFRLSLSACLHRIAGREFLLSYSTHQTGRFEKLTPDFRDRMGFPSDYDRNPPFPIHSRNFENIDQSENSNQLSLMPACESKSATSSEVALFQIGEGLFLAVLFLTILNCSSD